MRWPAGTLPARARASHAEHGILARMGAKGILAPAAGRRVAVLSAIDMGVCADESGQEEGGACAGGRSKLARAGAQLLHA